MSEVDIITAIKEIREMKQNGFTLKKAFKEGRPCIDITFNNLECSDIYFNGFEYLTAVLVKYLKEKPEIEVVMLQGWDYQGYRLFPNGVDKSSSEV